MRNKNLMFLCGAALLSAAVPFSASAAGLTLGANVGSARINSGDFEGDDTGWKAHIGSSFGEVIGAEVGYIDFGKFGVEGTGANAWAPALTLGFPIGLAKLYGKGGVAFGDFEGSSVADESESTDPFWGAGLRIGMPRGLGFRAEYERYNFDVADVDVAMAGLEFNF